MVNDTYLGKDTLAVQRIQERIARDISGYMKKSDIKITGRDIVTQALVPGSPSATIPTREQVSSYYDKLLEGKVNDGLMKRQAIKYAEVMIQPTTFARINLTLEKGFGGTLKVICTLPEHSVIFSKWWYGKYIDSNTFPTLVKQFQSYLRKYRTARVIIEANPTTEGKVTNVSSTFTFA